MNNAKRINIMTSCNDRIVFYILPQLVSIEENMHDYDVHFYLVHSSIDPNNVLMLEEFTKAKTGITFHEIRIEDTSLYEAIATGGGPWPCEAYFPLRVQDYLPDDVDRIWYIDAGDVIVCGDAAPYYFSDFEGNSMIVTPAIYKTNPITGEQEQYTKDDILEISDGKLFNSGSYVIDVEKFRRDGYAAEDYLYLSELLKNNAKHDFYAYMGDQGFLAAAFVEDTMLFGYPEKKDISYMPYNYVTSFYGQHKRKPICEPVVLHYSMMAKPWIVRFTEEAINMIIDKPDFITNNLCAPIPEIMYMTPQHLRHCEVWWKYAKETSIYEARNTIARITADSWVMHYLPICVKYNDLVQLINTANAKQGNE